MYAHCTHLTLTFILLHRTHRYADGHKLAAAVESSSVDVALGIGTSSATPRDANILIPNAMG